MTQDGIKASVLQPALIESLFAAFQRIVAAYCLLFGVFYWIRLIGYFPGPLWRFDTMPVEWQVVSVTLAALYPVAGIGLWMTASWGPVIWFICAAIEIVMYGVMGGVFGSRWMLVASYILIALLYIGFRAALVWHARQTRK
ncbi:DUF6163 family protein [Aquibium sp. ELW1220]|uniref:DUF6163 family protein n=1 Tax=Aquibium sp. ELW1220 TaxID=2976766 RepID=UPI0025B1EB61|nr:DUF6163 family protein [Aquibium sp. ELW1220]MDN2582798.1 DUF6163 family protein [Aquibium sp. ELW1220]